MTPSNYQLRWTNTKRKTEIEREREHVRERERVREREKERERERERERECPFSICWLSADERALRSCVHA